tara:strand:- start:146 stop:799 length:654 start_codon:yes stop_codon:yes gene_type:complete
MGRVCNECGAKHYAKGLCKRCYEKTPKHKESNKRCRARPHRKAQKREYNVKYWAEHKEELKLKHRLYFQKPEVKKKEKIRGQERRENGEYKEYYHKNKGVRNKQSQEWHMKNPDYRSNWQKENPKKCLENSLRYLKNAAKPFDLSVSGYKLALKIWHDVIEKRDIVCQMCGGNQKLEAHHLLYRANYPLLSFNENNGILLCRMCHYHTHGKKLISTE